MCYSFGLNKNIIVEIFAKCIEKIFLCIGVREKIDVALQWFRGCVNGDPLHFSPIDQFSPTVRLAVRSISSFDFEEFLSASTDATVIGVRFVVLFDRSFSCLTPFSFFRQ